MTDYNSYKSWPFNEAKKIVKRFGENNTKEKIIFETGYGPSGLPHIGTFGEVLRTNMVRFCYEKLTGKQTDLIAFSDDMDGFRKVPDNIPNKEKLSKYLDYPLTSVPDPFDEFKSFGEHNNSKLKEFLNRFNLPFTFQSSTDAYKSGLFNDTIKKIIKNYNEIKNVVLPTLGEERRKSYSPFFPINEKTGKILQVPIEEVNYDDFTVSYYEDGELKSKSVLDGNCKLQWKVDWAMRWAAFGVDYEMCGKDLTDSYSLSSKICRIIGSKPPENLIYELFLDENAEKISKSKGNGISIDDWLKYSIEESLSMFMYQRPTTAKKLFFDVIPKNTDEYLSHVNKFNSDDQNADNPAWHIHKSVNPLYSSKINYSLILNVISVCKSEDPNVIFGLIKNYQKNFSEVEEDLINRMIDCGINYFKDFIQPNLKFKIPNSEELIILKEVVKKLKEVEPSADADEFQTVIFSVGKNSIYKENIREFFKLIYLVVFGQENGPRLGSFTKIYTKDKTLELFNSKLNV